MTVIAAYVDRGVGCIMGDYSSSGANMVVRTNSPKVVELKTGNSKVSFQIGVAGNTRLAQVITSMEVPLDSSFDSDPMQRVRNWMHQQYMPLLISTVDQSGLIFPNETDNGPVPEMPGLALALVTVESRGAIIFRIDRDFQCIEVDGFCAIGSGAEYAMGAMALFQALYGKMGQDPTTVDTRESFLYRNRYPFVVGDESTAPTSAVREALVAASRFCPSVIFP